MSNATIYTAFVTLVEAFANNASPALTVGYPDVGFTPPASGEWLEVDFFPNETNSDTIDDGGPKFERGFFQVQACTRPGEGLFTGLTLANALIQTFGKGSEIGGVRVEREPWVSSKIQDSDRVRYPVTIPYRGDSDSDAEFALFFYGGDPDTTFTSALSLFGGGP